MKKALITGITGQDGSYLTELLLSKDYEVHGMIRRASTFNTSRIDHIYVDPHEKGARLFLHYGDLSDSGQISNIIQNIKPDEVYNLAAQTHVRVSFDIPEYTCNVTALGTTRILEAIKRNGNNTKFYQASSSEMFGSSPAPQNEETIFRPRSPYAIAKVHAYWMTVNYRESWNSFASNGILFNHESPRRGEIFLTRKVTRAVANILAGNQKILYLGNLEAKRDWGYAPEYVWAIWKILQLDNPVDLVIGTGESHSVGDFVEQAFSYVDLPVDKHVKIDPRYFRPTETEELIADTNKAKSVLNWSPKIGFDELVKVMIDSDMRSVGLKPIGEGDKILEKIFPAKWWLFD